MTLEGKYVIEEMAAKLLGNDYILVTLRWLRPAKHGGTYKTEITAQVPVSQEEGMHFKIGDEFSITCYCEK